MIDFYVPRLYLKVAKCNALFRALETSQTSSQKVGQKRPGVLSISCGVFEFLGEAEERHGGHGLRDLGRREGHDERAVRTDGAEVAVHAGGDPQRGDVKAAELRRYA